MPPAIEPVGLSGSYPSPVALRFETRASDSPWVDTVWTCASEHVAEMTSVAAVCRGLVFWQREGGAYAAISGPETKTGTAPVPEGATFVAIEFAVGTSLRAVPTAALVDGGVGRTARQLREGAGGAIALRLDQRTS